MNTQSIQQMCKEAAQYLIVKNVTPRCFALLVFIVATNSIGQTQPLVPVPYALSLTTAFEKALENHGDLQLARNRLDQAKAQTSTRFGALLPKVFLGTSLIRNVPEVLDRLPDRDPMDASLYRDVATLIRKNGDAAEADSLEKHADSMQRRDAVPRFILNPKYEARGTLTVEIPLFSGPDLAFLIASGNNDALAYARMKEATAKTLKKTALAYFSAVHQKQLLDFYEDEENSARTRYFPVSSEKPTVAARLHADAHILQRQAEKERAIADYHQRIAELGLLVGISGELVLEESPTLNFDALTADADRLLEGALKNRWDVKSEQRAIAVAQGGRLSNFLSFLPTITLQGDALYTSNEKGLLGENFLYAISLNARFYLFEGGMGFSRLRESGLRRQEHEIKFRELSKEIGITIHAQKARIAHLYTLIKAHEAKVLATKESERDAAHKYKNKRITFENYLDVIDRRFCAEITLKKAQAELISEKIALLYEVGMFTPQESAPSP